jgi:signal transduction histidine kinase
MTPLPPPAYPVLEEPVRSGLLQRPFPLALLFAGTYTALSLAYIRISSAIAAGLAGSVEELQSMEELKGFLFVVFSGLLLLAMSWGLLRALQHRNNELLRSRSVLASSERLAIAGIFASSMAHDINNVLTVIQGNLDLLRESPTLSNSDRRQADEMGTACDRLGAMARRLLHSARQNTAGCIQQGDLVPVVREALDFARSHRGVKRCNLDAELPGSLPMPVNHALLTRALLNLIINAADAVAVSGGRILVEVQSQPGWAVLQVHDNGPGIPQSMRDRLFEPFLYIQAGRQRPGSFVRAQLRPGTRRPGGPGGKPPGRSRLRTAPAP